MAWGSDSFGQDLRSELLLCSRRSHRSRFRSGWLLIISGIKRIGNGIWRRWYRLTGSGGWRRRRLLVILPPEGEQVRIMRFVVASWPVVLPPSGFAIFPSAMMIFPPGLIIFPSAFIVFPSAMVVELAAFPPMMFRPMLVSSPPLALSPGMLLFIIHQCQGSSAFIKEI